MKWLERGDQWWEASAARIIDCAELLMPDKGDTVREVARVIGIGAPDRATPWCTYGTSRSLAEPEQESPQQSCWGLYYIRESGDAQS